MTICHIDYDSQYPKLWHNSCHLKNPSHLSFMQKPFILFVTRPELWYTLWESNFKCYKIPGYFVLVPAGQRLYPDHAAYHFVVSAKSWMTEIINCLNFWDEAWWLLSLRVFRLLSSSLLLFSQHFGRYVLWPSSGVCWTQEPSWNLNPWGSPVLILLAITGYKC